MTIAIIGAGNVGQALARGFIAASYPVRFGVPDPGKHAALTGTLGALASVHSVQISLESADTVLLATPYAAALQVASDVGDWQNRVLVDATNPIAPGMTGLLVGTTRSGAEEVALRAKGARVVKAFNTTGFENMIAPRFAAGGLFLPVAGDDAAAKQTVIALAKVIGFDAVDVGALAVARYTEPMAMVWIEMAIRLGYGRRFGFVRQQAAG